MKARTRAAATLAAAVLFLAAAAPARADDLSPDFNAINQWLAKGMAQGLGFNAGESLDPPHEVIDRRLQPDISFGAGEMPLNKEKFPAMQSPAMQNVNPSGLFPASVLFPNLTVHLRAGLPFRMDVALRAADMTTPPGYKLSSGVSAKGQSNSFGATLRKHFLGGEGLPLFSLGANFNHVRGRFNYNTMMNVNDNGFDSNSAVNGSLAWNVNSYGLNAVVSQAIGRWTPFAGLGYNYVTGSVTSTLATTPSTFLVLPTYGASSQTPERDNGRLLFGVEHEGSLFHLFVSGEVKATGVDAGKSWIVQSGLSLPFHLGWGGGSGYASSVRPGSEETSAAAPRTRRKSHERVVAIDKDDAEPGLVFIQ